MLFDIRLDHVSFLVNKLRLSVLEIHSILKTCQNAGENWKT